MAARRPVQSFTGFLIYLLLRLVAPTVLLVLVLCAIISPISDILTKVAAVPAALLFINTLRHMIQSITVAGEPSFLPVLLAQILLVRL